MNKFYFTNEDVTIIKNIFENSKYKILIFGSRTKGMQQKFSDVDICLRAQSVIPLSEMAEYKENLQESDLAFAADLIDYHTLDNEFKTLIDREARELSQLVPCL